MRRFLLHTLLLRSYCIVTVVSGSICAVFLFQRGRRCCQPSAPFVLSSSRWIVTPVPINAIRTINQVFRLWNADTASRAHNTAMALAFSATVMPCPVRYPLIYGPNTRLDSRRRPIFGLPKEKHAAAAITSGVVGRTGRKIPTDASPSNSQPLSESNRVFISAPAPRNELDFFPGFSSDSRETSPF